MDNGQREGFVAEIVSWETHSRPAAGEYTQAVLNDQFPDDIDIFVGMMGTYFGTPTKHWGSGTEEEFRNAYERWGKTKTPEIMFYFSDTMPSLSQINPEQLSKRNSFRNEIGELGVYYFSYTDITEFQFDLHNHISSAIHDVLKGKAVGRDEAVIPQESASNLTNFNALLTQDPLVNAVLVVDEAAGHLNNYTKLMEDLNSDARRISRTFVKESKNIVRAKQNGKQQKIQKSIECIYSELSGYSKRMALRIPKLSTEFSGSVISGLRAIKMVKSNHLEEVMPLAGMVSKVAGTRKSLEALIEIIRSLEAAFTDWPDEIMDLLVQKKIIIALHRDLVASLTKAVELLGKFTDEYALQR